MKTLIIQIVKAGIFAFALAVFIPTAGISQNVAINDNGADPNSNAILDIDISTNNKGVLIPRLTEAQKNAMSLETGDEGLMIYQDDQGTGFWYWDGTQWLTLLADTNQTRTIKETLAIAGKGAGATKTTTIVFDNNIVEQFSINDELYFSEPIPIDYASGDVIIYVDFVPMGSETGKTVHWHCIYKVHAEHSVLSGTTGTAHSGDLALHSTQYQEQDINFTIPEADITDAEAIHFRIKRVAIDTGTDPSTDPAVVHVSLKYTANR